MDHVDFYFFLCEIFGSFDAENDAIFGGGHRLFHFMAMQGHEFLMRFMIGKFPCLNLFCKDEVSGETAVSLALRHNRLSVAEYLIRMDKGSMLTDS